jgi:hypothetical protein
VDEGSDDDDDDDILRLDDSITLGLRSKRSILVALLALAVRLGVLVGKTTNDVMQDSCKAKSRSTTSPK